MRKITPLGNKVVVRLNEVGEVDTGGVLLLTSIGPREATVVAVGPGITDEVMHVTEGDIVILPKGDLIELDLGDQKYYILTQTEILAIV